jgi:NAD(P)-dependent dehydrogenase (short-subunit alcohol dehydrogenase family)
MQLEGKRALVTGAGRGLGLAIATKFAEYGASVALADLDDATANAAAAQLGGDAFAVHCDVTSSADVQAAIAATTDRFGGMDVIVNNAGIEIGKPLPEISDDEFDLLMRINVNGVFYGIKYAVPALAATQGTIINMSSVAGLGTAAFLASDDARWVNGAYYILDNALTASVL